MITNIRIRNFKGLEDAEFALGAAPVVLVGPNNCGKTSILQALTMWHVGALEWIEHHTPKKNGGVLRGVPIPAGHFLALPPTNTIRLWHKGKALVRRSGKFALVPIQVDVSGETAGASWNIGVEFVRHGRDGVICRPMSEGVSPEESAADVAARWRKALPQVEFVPPMSGMAWREDKLTPGSIISRFGEGRTAEILRNILAQLSHPEGVYMTTPDKAERRWKEVADYARQKFLVQLGGPALDSRGALRVSYREDDHEYELSSGGRGFHQTLLTLAALHLRPGGVFLLDEPDAHLEGVRQRDNFFMYSEIAEKHNSQLIIASHSEVVMQHAGPEGIVGIVGGKTVSLNDNAVRAFEKLLRDIGWDKVAAAKAAGHIVFLEGNTDINILAALAKKTFRARGEEAAEKIRLANVETVDNNAPKARDLFSGLRSGIPELRGYALFDGDVAQLHPKLVNESDETGGGKMTMQLWRRLEIENYILLPEALYRHAEAEDAARNQAESEDPQTFGLPLPPPAEKTNAECMREAFESVVPLVARESRKDPYWREQKMSVTIVRVMERFSKLRGGAGAWSKRRCHTLVQYMKPDEIPPEVRDKIVRLLKVIDPDFNPEKPNE